MSSAGRQAALKLLEELPRKTNRDGLFDRMQISIDGWSRIYICCSSFRTDSYIVYYESDVSRHLSTEQIKDKKNVIELIKSMDMIENVGMHNNDLETFAYKYDSRQ